jgi:hypothetical protein
MESYPVVIVPSHALPLLEKMGKITAGQSLTFSECSNSSLQHISYSSVDYNLIEIFSHLNYHPLAEVEIACEITQ